MIILSYPLGKINPSYGQTNKKLEIIQIRDTRQGDTSNNYSVLIENHVGSHIDAPAHFFTAAKTISEYSQADLIFEQVQIIDVDLASGQLLRVEDILDKVNQETDLLLLRSGWSEKRELEEYSMAGPGIQAQVGLMLRNDFPRVRCVGMDWISISSFLHRQEGREAHRAFLDPDGVGNPILILEDINIPLDMAEPTSVMIVPWMIEGIDSAPVTVISYK